MTSPITTLPTPVGRGRLEPVHWGSLSSLPKREPLINGLIDIGTMSAIVGATSSCKTGIALDLACHSALGRKWRGRAVRQGSVLYLASEGGHGIAARLAAWQRHYHAGPEDGSLFIVPEPIDLCHGFDDAQRVLSHISDNPALVLIVIDTLSRALAGGDENGSRDMGQFVINCDQMRQQTGAHVCVLHHLGKDQSRGARGHSLLKAALDTELTVTKTGRVGVIEVTKQRDHPDGEIFGFASEVVDLGEGKQSFVIVPSEVPAKTINASKLSPKYERARRALAALSSSSKAKVPPPDWGLPAGIVTVPVNTWRDELFCTGILDKSNRRARKSFWDLKQALAARNLIGERDGLAWLTDPHRSLVLLGLPSDCPAPIGGPDADGRGARPNENPLRTRTDVSDGDPPHFAYRPEDKRQCLPRLVDRDGAKMERVRSSTA
jgi:hypothetical protein